MILKFRNGETVNIAERQTYCLTILDNDKLSTSYLRCLLKREIKTVSWRRKVVICAKISRRARIKDSQGSSLIGLELFFSYWTSIPMIYDIKYQKSSCA